MKNWKFPAGCALFAFIIALLSGLLGGVEFGRLLLRAVISSVIFGGIAYGVMLVIRSRLPDLYALFSPSPEYGEERDGVDIIISDDDEPEDVSASAAASSKSEDDSFAEEVSELSGGFSEDSAQQSAGEGVGELESADSDMDREDVGSEDAPAAAAAAADDTVDETETPQELGEMDDTFEKFGNVDDVADISGKEAEAVEIMGDFQDPQDVARAVKTMMKKDEE